MSPSISPKPAMPISIPTPKSGIDGALSSSAAPEMLEKLPPKKESVADLMSKVPKRVDGLKAFTAAATLLKQVQEVPLIANSENDQAFAMVSQALAKSSALLQQGRSDLEKRIPAAIDLSNIIATQATQLAYLGGQISGGSAKITSTKSPGSEDPTGAPLSASFGDVTGQTIPQVVKNAELAAELLQKVTNNQNPYPGYL